MATPAIARAHPSSFPVARHYSRDRKSRAYTRNRGPRTHCRPCKSRNGRGSKGTTGSHQFLIESRLPKITRGHWVPSRRGSIDYSIIRIDSEMAIILDPRPPLCPSLPLSVPQNLPVCCLRAAPPLFLRGGRRGTIHRYIRGKSKCQKGVTRSPRERQVCSRRSLAAITNSDLRHSAPRSLPSLPPPTSRPPREISSISV